VGLNYPSRVELGESGELCGLLDYYLLVGDLLSDNPTPDYLEEITIFLRT
jgi:hypothetical protein